jgi:hypothetical protein
MIPHLGRSSGDIDPKQAAHENRILVCLHTRGALRENEVKIYTTSARQVGNEIHNRAVQHLVEGGLIRKLSTTRANSFILELAGKRQNPVSPTDVEWICELDRMAGDSERQLRSKIFLGGLRTITHLGRPDPDIDPKQAAHENRILVCLQKRGTLRENEVKLYTASTRRVGREIHNQAVQSLVKRGLIRKVSTTRANSFILELTGKLQNPVSPTVVKGLFELDRMAGQSVRKM